MWMVKAATARLCAYRVRERWALKIDSHCTISTWFVLEGYESPRITHRRWGAKASLGRKISGTCWPPLGGTYNVRLWGHWGTLSWGTKGPLSRGRGCSWAWWGVHCQRLLRLTGRLTCQHKGSRHRDRERAMEREIPRATKLDCPEPRPENLLSLNHSLGTTVPVQLLATLASR